MITDLFQFWLGMIFKNDEDAESESGPKASNEKKWINRARVIVGSLVTIRILFNFHC
jgi:hypothetical protein